MKLLTLFILVSTTIYAGEISIMTYNVENLFDTSHDKDKNDWTYLPFSVKEKKKQCNNLTSNYRRRECLATDWTNEKLKIKVSQIKRAVTRDRGELPTILNLVEIENEKVVKLLAKELGYQKVVVSNSPDKRGIDLAILYNSSEGLRFITSQEHSLKDSYFERKPTRNILEGHFKIKEKNFYLFVNHWPSLANPDKARVIAASVLKGRIKDIKEKEPHAYIMAVGDFNTVASLKKPGNLHPFRDVLLRDTVLNDLRDTFMEDPKVPKKLKKNLSPGTYYYKSGKEWNNLDRIFISNNLIEGKSLKVDIATFDIYSPTFLREKGSIGAPRRYNYQANDVSQAGFSDHFPLVVNLKY